MKILLLGRNGQVGRALLRQLATCHEVIALGREGADFGEPGVLSGLVRTTRPQVVINAAAYTAVDRAESEPALAMRVNATAVAELAQAVAELGGWLIHYSTDYVFDGSNPEPYREEDSPRPINVYGRTKLAGEEAVRNSGCQHLIFRSSWVYSHDGGNFARTMLRLAAERDELKVVGDQTGTPTSAALIASVTALAVQRIESGTPLDSGIYHLTASGETTWHAYACFLIATARAAGWPIRVSEARILRVSSAEFGSTASRPARSVLDGTKLCRAFGVTMPPWQDGVHELLEALTLNQTP